MTVLSRLAGPLRSHGASMNIPPNPPSPADDEARKRHEVWQRERLVRHLKRTFPGLPY